MLAKSALQVGDHATSDTNNVSRCSTEVIDVGTRTLLNERFALRCGDRHQAEAILSAGTFQPGDLIGASVGRALWSDGGPAKPVQFFEVPDTAIPDLACAGFAFG